MKNNLEEYPFPEAAVRTVGATTGAIVAAVPAAGVKGSHVGNDVAGVAYAVVEWLVTPMGQLPEIP